MNTYNFKIYAKKIITTTRNILFKSKKRTGSKGNIKQINISYSNCNIYKVVLTLNTCMNNS